MHMYCIIRHPSETKKNLDSPPELDDALCVPHNLVAAQLALAVDPIDKRDGDFADGVAE